FFLQKKEGDGGASCGGGAAGTGGPGDECLDRQADRVARSRVGRRGYSSQPDVDDRRFAEATSQAALQMVLDRVGRFSANDKVDDFVTDACATVAMAYHHA